MDIDSLVPLALIVVLGIHLYMAVSPRPWNAQEIMYHGILTSALVALPLYQMLG